MEKREPSSTIGGNVIGTATMEDSKKVQKKKKTLKIELPYDPAIPHLGTYLEKTIIEKIHAPQRSWKHCSQRPRQENAICKRHS